MVKTSNIPCTGKQIQTNCHILEAAMAKIRQIKAFNKAPPIHIIIMKTLLDSVDLSKTSVNHLLLY